MSIQTIINNAQSLQIDKTKLTAQTISRSGRVLTAEVASAVPYRFTVQMHSGLKYSDNRGMLEELDRLDRIEEEEIDIGDTNTGLQYITAYQGDMTAPQRAALRTASGTAFSGTNLYINTIPVAGGIGYLFRKGDFVQIGSGTYRYPYQVTADVPYTNISNVTIPVHRAVIAQDGVSLTSGSVNYGKNVSWRVKMLQKPSYSVVPHDRIEFDSDFQFIEVIE
jgi:hypothetical protein